MINCQRPKVRSHVDSPIGIFNSPDARFDQIKINMVGPLKSSHRYNYVPTCIDRFTTTAESVARHFVEGWTAVYDCPSFVTTDRKKQSGSVLFSSIIHILGTGQICMIPHHKKDFINSEGFSDLKRTPTGTQQHR